MDAKVQVVLAEFARRRAALIRAADRTGLDATYSPSCLGRRNDYNRHDYEWYLSLIECGFGAELPRIDIEPVGPGAALPFAGLVTYPWPPDYRVFVHTVTGRRTLWLVRLFDGTPLVVLPAFDGRTADSVATGSHRTPVRCDPVAERTTVLTFPRERFVAEVANTVTTILHNWAERLKYETLRAVALACCPWYRGGCCVSLLTTREDFPEEEYGKWAIGDWRWHELAELGVELSQVIHTYYRGETEPDTQQPPEQRAAVIFECLAEALHSVQVGEALAGYERATDFELGVFDPDHPSHGNYCDRVRGGG